MNKKLIGLALLLTLASTLGACKSDNAPDGGASPGGGSPAPNTSPS